MATKRALDVSKCPYNQTFQQPAFCANKTSKIAHKLDKYCVHFFWPKMLQHFSYIGETFDTLLEMRCILGVIDVFQSFFFKKKKPREGGSYSI